MNRKERLEHYKKMYALAKKVSWKDKLGFCTLNSMSTPKLVFIQNLPELYAYKPENSNPFWFNQRNIWKRRRILKRIIRKMERSEDLKNLF